MKNDEIKCPCGSEVGRNGMLCDVCEADLLNRINMFFSETDIAYLKEVFYLR